MSTVLVTGANRGLGLEFARQFHGDGWDVLATCREPDAAQDLLRLGIEPLRLDVTETGTFPAFAAGLAGRPIDLLVNNAGVYGADDQTLEALDARSWLDVLLVDAIAPILLARALLDNLAQARAATGSGVPDRSGRVARQSAPVIANITSKMGSIAENSSGGVYQYRSAKAALNAASRSLALDLRARGILVVALHPGWVKTDMGGPGASITTETSVTGLRRVIERLSPADSGGFFAFDGQPVPW